MSADNIAPIAQDNTDAAGGTTTAATEAKRIPEASPEAKGNASPPAAAEQKQSDAAEKEAPKSAREERKALFPPKPLMMGKDEGKAPAESPVDGGGEEYQLSFPEGSYVDTEAVAALNRVGREFGISNEKAQELATVATEYGNRRVEAQFDYLKKGYVDFCAKNQEATRAMYGEKSEQAFLEARQGLEAVLRSMPEGHGITLEEIGNDPDVSAIFNVPWFIHLCRTAAQYTTEQPGIHGGKSGDDPAGGFRDVKWI